MALTYQRLRLTSQRHLSAFDKRKSTKSHSAQHLAATVARSLGLKVHEPRNNPNDLVPNLAGGNDLSPSGLTRSLRFVARVFGNDVGASPHTLPYLGLETYKTQLRMLGRHRKADSVQKYINKHAS